MAFILLNFALLIIAIKGKSKLIEAVLKSAVAMSLLILLYSEIMSIFAGINTTSFVLLHSLVAIGLLVFIAQKKINPIAVFKIDLSSIKTTPVFIAIVLFCALIFGATFISAFLYPPNTSDSMTYHMPRIMQWIQNGSLSHFPTHSLRQLYLAPFAEIISMNFLLFAKSDGVCNYVQWFSFIGCCLAMFEITKLLGGSLRAQYFAFLITATIPMAVLQASGTQTDLVVSFFICLFIYFMLKYIDDKSFWNLVFLASATGFAVLTKGTAYFVLAPFIIYLLISIIKAKKFSHILLLGLIFLLINIGHFARNYSVFATILVPKEHKAFYQVDVFKPNHLFINLLRSLTYNTTVANNSIAQAQIKGIERLQVLLGVENNSELITFPNTTFTIDLSPDNELTTGNVFHFSLMLLFLLLLPFSQKLKTDKRLLAYILCVFIGFTLMGVLVKWQPWGSRLFLPFIILTSAFLARFMENEKLKFVMNLLIVIFFITSLAPLFYNHMRPLGIKNAYNYTRYEHMFNNRFPEIKRFYKVSEFLAPFQNTNLGLITSDDQYEYPLWFLIKGKNIRIQHINVQNESKKLLDKKPYVDFVPQIKLRI